MIKIYQEPFDFFNKWYDLAKSKAANLDVITIATANEENQPSLEMGLLKEFSYNGLKIISNSKKITQDSKIAICIYWPELGYQVRIEGVAENIIENEVIVKIKSIEFWSDGKYRLHKRIIYIQSDDKKEWQLKKLYP